MWNVYPGAIQVEGYVAYLKEAGFSGTPSQGTVMLFLTGNFSSALLVDKNNDPNIYRDNELPLDG
jgi:hypothetical protein